MADAKLEQLLQEDVDRAEMDFRKSVFILGALLLFVFGYMHWAYSQLRQMVEPRALAEASIGFAHGYATDALAEVAESGPEYAPKIAGAALRLLEESAATAVWDLESHLHEHQLALQSGVESWLGDYFDELIAANPQIGQLQGKTISVDDVFRGVEDDLRRDLQEFIDGAVGPEVTEATATMRDLADRLTRYASVEGLSGAEREERELILAWLEILHFHSLDLGALYKLGE
jgi:hypothetical protein